MIVREIVEKPSGSTPPPPPQPPKASSKGFPIAARRQRPPKPSTESIAAGPSRTRQEASRGVTPERFASLDLGGPGIHPHKPHARIFEADEIRRSVDQENLARVEGMTEEEREQESHELLERFGSGLAALMRKRREQRQSRPAESASQSAQSSKSEADKVRGEVDQENWERIRGMDQKELGEEIKELQDRFGSGVLSALGQRAQRRQGSASAEGSSNQPPHKRREVIPESDELKEKYFPTLRTEEDKLAWLKPSTPSSDHSVRFDLSGRVLSSAQMASIPTTAGLHHHGTSPDLAGYTVDDVLWLSRSTVPSQRITMLGVLGKIVAADIAGELDTSARQVVEKTGAKSKAIDMAVDIILASTRSIGILRAGIELLYESLGLQSWSGNTTRYTPDRTEDGFASMPFEELLPRTSELLGKNSGLPPASIHQLIRVLQRSICESQDLAEAVAPLVPKLVRERVFACPWPLDEANPPHFEALTLVRAVVESSRSCADTILEADIVQSLLKYLVVSSWPDDASAAAQDLAIESIKIISALGRYGLSASLATTATDIFRNLGQWIRTNGREAPGVSKAYFDLLAVWTTCSIDPHKTTPEHALTWAQVSALGWADEAVEVVSSLVKDGSSVELASVLGLLNAWAAGASINESNAGAAEKVTLAGQLLSAGLGELVTTDHEVLAQLIRLDQALGSTLIDKEKRRDLAGRYLASIDASPELRYRSLLSIKPEDWTKPEDWVKNALSILASFQPGSEPDALDLLDSLLKHDFASLPEISGALEKITHKDKLQILRPLLHYAILPVASHVVGPTIPSHLYLKVTTTLRSPPLPDPNEKREPGLPLSPDWLFTPINELLSSSSSPGIAQAPPDWDPSELDIVRATLVLARAQQLVSPDTLSRSQVLLNAIKVFMLEHDQSNASAGQEGEAFRDDTVSASLSALIAPTTAPISTPSRQQTLEEAALPFLGPEVPFFQFFTDFVALYQAISFSDPVFSQLVLPPLAMTYAVDYRKLVWVEHASSLRSIRTPVKDVPLEDMSYRVFLQPAEEDRDVLAGYTQALVRGWVSSRQGFLFRVATWHLASLFWSEAPEEATKGGEEDKKQVEAKGQPAKEDEKAVKKDGEAGPSRDVVRKNLLRAIVSSASDEVIKAVTTANLLTPEEDSKASKEEIDRRLAILDKEGGPKATEKVARIIA